MIPDFSIEFDSDFAAFVVLVRGKSVGCYFASSAANGKISACLFAFYSPTKEQQIFQVDTILEAQAAILRRLPRIESKGQGKKLQLPNVVFDPAKCAWRVA
jgi:hypothetical protein